MISSVKKARRRSATEISKLLQEKLSGGETTAAFCSRHGLSNQTFYNWQNKYGARSVMQSNFIPVSVDRSVDSEPLPFCDLIISEKTAVRFFKAVDATYLKSLIAH